MYMIFSKTKLKELIVFLLKFEKKKVRKGSGGQSDVVFTVKEGESWGWCSKKSVTPRKHIVFFHVQAGSRRDTPKDGFGQVILACES